MTGFSVGGGASGSRGDDSHWIVCTSTWRRHEGSVGKEGDCALGEFSFHLSLK